MDFGLTEEQTMFRDSVARFLKDAYSFKTRQALIAAGNGFAEDHWQTFAELGWLAAPIAEDFDGLGGGAVEVAVVMDQMGRALCVSPYLPVVTGAVVISTAANDEIKQAMLPGVAAGEVRAVLAHAEREARHERTYIETRAVARDGGYALSGTKAAVPFVDFATHFIVPARTGGDAGDAHGITLFMVPADANGLSIAGYATQDGGRAGDVALEGVAVAADQVIGAVDNGFEALDRALDWAAAQDCARAVGAMWAVHEQTLDYLKTREQFGAKLSSFQALQHRMVDIYMRCELAQSVAMDAIAALERDDATERRLAVSAAKVQVGRLGRLVGQEGIQLHGGVGMTDDFAVGHHFKDLTMGALAHGDVDWHLRRYARIEVREGHNRQPLA